MSAGRCCRGESASIAGEAGGIPPRPVRRSFVRNVGWLVPGAVLAVLPKCPACLAAYVAIGSGLAISASAASRLRSALLVVCVAWLSLSAARAIRRFRAAARPSDRPVDLRVEGARPVPFRSAGGGQRTRPIGRLPDLPPPPVVPTICGQDRTRG